MLSQALCLVLVLRRSLTITTTKMHVRSKAPIVIPMMTPSLRFRDRVFGTGPVVTIEVGDGEGVWIDLRSDIMSAMWFPALQQTHMEEVSFERPIIELKTSRAAS